MNNNSSHIITDSDRTVASFAHLSAFTGFLVPFGNLIAPTVIYFMKREESEFIAEHAREAINFQISMLIAFLAAWVLLFTIIGIPFALVFMLAIPIINIVCIIIAAIKASDGERYEYPLTLRLLK